ncbi:MAG: hypothetical protein Q4C95_04630 [Planctomycetia bacterium]|nr:hypothetical protein [Planctomycetia bacterium]
MSFFYSLAQPSKELLVIDHNICFAIMLKSVENLESSRAKPVNNGRIRKMKSDASMTLFQIDFSINDCFLPDFCNDIGNVRAASRRKRKDAFFFKTSEFVVIKIAFKTAVPFEKESFLSLVWGVLSCSLRENPFFRRIMFYSVSRKSEIANEQHK